MKKFTLALCALCAIIFSFTEAKQQKRTVTIWSFAENNCEEWKMRKNDIDNKFNIDLQIELVAQNKFVKKLYTAMREGEGKPDIIEWMIENNRILYSDPDKSFVTPLNKYIDKYGLTKKVIKSRFSPITYSGNIYGLPHGAHPAVLVYNDTVWKRAGVDLSTVETWDEFFEEAKKLNKLKRKGKQVHFALPSGNGGLGDSMFMIWQQTEIPIVTKDGKPAFNSPEFVEFARKWEKWMKTGAMTMWDWGNFSELIKDGTYASYIAPDWWVSQTDAAAAKGKYDFKIRNLPVYKKGMKYGSSWGGSFLAIPKGTADPEKIFKIMEHIQYDETSVIERYNETGMIPPLYKLWNHDVFNNKDKRFGYQKTAQIQIKSASNQPAVLMADHFWNYIADFNLQYNEYFIEKRISFNEMFTNTQNNATLRMNTGNAIYRREDDNTNIMNATDDDEDVYDE
jgi:ABC-type glycerol-3-phosphate transport system substrate-binding protein